MNLGVHKYSSKTVAVPIELLQDSNADIEAFVNNRLITRLGRITNKHFTVGTGSSQPSGVLTGATLGVTGAKAQVDSVTYDDLVELEHSLDPAYREGGRCAFMFADATLKAIKKLKDGQGRPLWLPGIDVKEPASILGYRYAVSYTHLDVYKRQIDMSSTSPSRQWRRRPSPCCSAISPSLSLIHIWRCHRPTEG